MVAEAQSEGIMEALPRRYAFTVQPVTFHAPDTQLGCNVARIVAYRARCTCGWDSPGRATYALARSEGVWHRGEHDSGEARE